MNKKKNNIYASINISMFGFSTNEQTFTNRNHFNCLDFVDRDVVSMNFFTHTHAHMHTATSHVNIHSYTACAQSVSFSLVGQVSCRHVFSVSIIIFILVIISRFCVSIRRPQHAKHSYHHEYLVFGQSECRTLCASYSRNIKCDSIDGRDFV